MAKKPVKATAPIDNLNALLRAGALRRLQGNVPANQSRNKRRAEGRGDSFSKPSQLVRERRAPSCAGGVERSLVPHRPLARQRCANRRARKIRRRLAIRNTYTSQSEQLVLLRLSACPNVPRLRCLPVFGLIFRNTGGIART